GGSYSLEYFIEPKVDGVSISLHYKNGQLVEALSRGDGKMGESLIGHIREMSSIPKTIDYSSELLVRGEIFITDSDFREIQASTQENQRQFISSRNYVAGALRLKETQLISEKKLSFCGYQVLFPDNNTSLAKQSDAIELLRSLHIPTHQKELTLISSNMSEI
ncbi:DNA ligase (NAD(+)) LigA, partial [Microbacterium esteraromaticum]